MSNIIKARGLITEALNRAQDAHRLLGEAIELYDLTLKYMRRESPVRRAKARHMTITPEIRDRVRKLAIRYPNMTTSEIAVRCGLRSAGRVSEILHNRR